MFPREQLVTAVLFIIADILVLFVVVVVVSAAAAAAAAAMLTYKSVITFIYHDLYKLRGSAVTYRTVMSSALDL